MVSITSPKSADEQQTWMALVPQVKICDFGLSRLKSELMTGTMQLLGFHILEPMDSLQHES